MLWQDDENPTYLRGLLEPAKLDFSLESLHHIDDYLEAVHRDRPDDEALFRVVLRAGAYLGEVVRRLRPGEFRWVAHDQAARHSKLIASLEHGLGTVAVLWKDDQNISFPLGKVCKFIENGREDSVYYFAVVIHKNASGAPI